MRARVRRLVAAGDAVVPAGLRDGPEGTGQEVAGLFESMGATGMARLRRVFLTQELEAPAT